MAKLYLIRRNLETFAGPMSLSEMKDAYERLQFGLQDEISGHCGPWIPLDDLERIKKHYPEVARILNEDLLKQWGVGTQPATPSGAEDTRQLKAESTRGIGLAVAFLLIALVAFVAAIYMANGTKLSSKNKDATPDPRPDEAQILLDRGDRLGFDAYMLTHADQWVEALTRQRAPEASLLPHLRLFAFSHEGQIAGLDSKILRGGGAPAAPIDCSLKAWKGRWRAAAADFGDFLDGHQLVRAHWARLLAWDPHWIRRRDNKGWLGPQNYYAGCLAMAERAFASVESELAGSVDSGQLTAIRSRLAWLVEAARGEGAAQLVTTAAGGGETAKAAVLPSLTCMEMARTLPALEACRTMTNPDPTTSAYQAYLDQRFGWNLLRLATGQRGSLGAELLAALGPQAARMEPEDQFTRFDYRAETRLIRTLSRPAASPVEKILERTQAEFPDVHLSH